MESHLKWPDYLILVAFIVISLAIGIYHSVTGGRQKTTAEFILADRRLSVIPTAISLLVSFQSAIMLLGMTAEMYCYGAQFLVFFSICVSVAVLLVERFIVPWLYPLKLVSIYDYLERRYMSKSIRIFGASMGILTGVLYMGVAMYAPSAALQSTTGLPLVVSIPVMAVVSVTYVYSSPDEKAVEHNNVRGGMRAVVWTDVFQFVIMLTGLVAILVKGLIVVGGIGNVFRLAEEEGRLVLANFSFDPRERHTVWNLGIGVVFYWFNTYGLTQASIQRFSAVDRLSKARITVLLNIPPMIFINVMACIVGLVVLAYYASIKCNPLANKNIANPNQLLPYFVVTIFADSPGFAGLFLATLYGGSLSTVSSLLSGSAANCWEDILKWKLNHLPETRKAFINRLLVILFGALATGLAFLSASVQGPVTQLVVVFVTLVGGPLLAFFVLGAVSKHANWKGTLFGGIVGLLVVFWLSIGSLMVRHKYPPLPPVSVEHCSHGNGNSTFFSSSLNYNNYTSFEFLEGIGAKNNWNQTTGALSDTAHYMNQLRGLENFYAMSYMLTLPFGAIVTGVISIIASFITRDRDLEEKVDKRLLLRFHGCGYWDENEKQNQEYVDDKRYSLELEAKGLKRPQDGFFEDMEITVLKENENGFHEGVDGNLRKA